MTTYIVAPDGRVIDLAELVRRTGFGFMPQNNFFPLNAYTGPAPVPEEGE